MKKSLFQTFLTVSMAAFAAIDTVCPSPSGLTVGGVEVPVTWTLDVDADGMSVTIVDVSPKVFGDYTIPSQFLKGDRLYTVKNIGSGAFRGSVGLVAVTVPNTVTNIGDRAFEDCTSLADITIGYGVRRIGEAPFANTMIQQLTLPDSLMRIDGSVRRGLANDLTFELEDPVTSHYALSEDGVLYSRDFDELVCCPTRQEQVIIPNTVTNIHKEAFCGCFRLQSLLIPESVTVIGDRAFACAEAPDVLPGSGQARSRLEQVVISASNLVSVGAGLFAGCRNLANVYFSGDCIDFDGVSAEVFADEEGFAPSADFVVNVNETLRAAFPAELLVGGRWSGKRIETYADLVNVSFSSVDAHGLKWSYRIVGNSAVICNAGQDGAAIDVKTRNNTYRYEYDENGVIIASYPILEIPTMLGGFPVKKLGAHALDGCGGITELKMADTLIEIGDAAFKDCSGLIDIPLTERIQRIGSAPFAGTGITTINLPASVIELDGNIGMGCRNLMTITAAGSAWFTVDGGLLYDSEKTHLYCCPSVKTSVSLPSTLREIGQDAFRGCTRLTTIDLPEATAVVGEGAFAECTGLTDIAFSESLKELGDGAFRGCSALGTVHFNGNAPFMGSSESLYAGTPDGLVTWVVEGATGWKDETDALPDDGQWPAEGVRRAIRRPGGGTSEDGGTTDDDDDAEKATSGTVVDDGGVEWSYTITDGLVKIVSVPTNTTGEVSIPEKLANFPVTGLGATAFADCSGITSIVIPARVGSIDPGAFNGCAALESFVVDAGSAAFKTVNGVLFTKNGKTLVKVPARYTVACQTTERRREHAEQTQSVPMRNGSALSTTTVVTGRDLIETVTMDVTPTQPIESLMGGVTNIADYAFTDCGFVAAGQMLDGTVAVVSNGVTTLTLTVNGKSVHTPIVNSQSVRQTYSGNVPSPVAVEVAHMATTNTVVDANSTWYDAQGRQHAATSSTTTEITLDRICSVVFTAPSSVKTIGMHAFDESGFTKVTCPGCTQTSSSVMSIRLVSRTRSSEAEPATAFVGASAAVFEGWLLKDGVVAGSLRVKSAKANAKGVVKLTATVQPLGGKKQTLKGVLAENGAATLQATRGGHALTVQLDETGFTGTFDGFAVEGGRTASAPPVSVAQTWGVVLETATATGSGAALAGGASGLSVAIGTKGKAKVTGTLADGTKVSVSSQLVAFEDRWCVPVVAPLYSGKKGGFAFLLVIGAADGTACVLGQSAWTALGKHPFAATWFEGASAQKVDRALVGTKLAFGAELPPGYSLDTVNPWKGWKPRTTAKTGLFKGTFFLYKTTNGRVKKVKVTVTGVVMGGIGSGSALIKNVASLPVFLSD